jgi:hypothetical protein
MKKLLTIFLFLILASNVGMAQKDEAGIETLKINYPYGVGPFVLFKGGVNSSEVPEGIKNGVAFIPMPDIGVTGYIPFTDDAKTGLAVDLAYCTYGYELKATFKEDEPSTLTFNYLTFGPSFHVSGFLVGFNFGIPLGGNIEAFNGSESDINSEDLATMVELRLGAMIPLVESQTGRLNLLLMGGYFLTGQYKEDNSGFNTHPASLGLGLNYIFNVSN